MVTLDEVILDTVKDIKPHGGTEELGTPLLNWTDMRLSSLSMTDIFNSVMSSHDGEGLRWTGEELMLRLLFEKTLVGSRNVQDIEVTGVRVVDLWMLSIGYCLVHWCLYGCTDVMYWCLHWRGVLA